MHMSPNITSILLIYTGGTIGMIENPETGALENFNLEQLKKHVPELQNFTFHIEETGVFGGHDTVRSSDGLFGHGPGSLAQTGAYH